MKITVSLSAYQAWQRCQMSYYYSYVRRLRPRVKDIAPQRGTLLHEYLANYYREIQAGQVDPPDAHAIALEMLDAKQPEMAEIASAAFYAGDEGQAQEYLDLIPAVKEIAGRYFDVRGRDDAEYWEIMLVEKSVRLGLFRGIDSRSIIDLVARHKGTGYVWLWEHKSPKSVPDSAVRLRDLQTMLYARVLEHTGVHVDGILWNYLRSKTPDIPHQNKDGRFSRAIAIDTTWSTYKQAIENAWQDVALYEDVRERLEGNDLTVWFPRFEHVVVADAEVLLEDYAKEALNMRRAQVAWEKGEKPIRTLGIPCSFCAYFRLCEAAITGGDEEDVIRMRFTEGREH